MVEIPDNDAPPPGWGQWENWPALAPEPAVGVLVMREDGCVMSRHPTHGTEASLSPPPRARWHRGAPGAEAEASQRAADAADPRGSYVVDFSRTRFFC
jgi:hypothetical protein